MLLQNWYLLRVKRFSSQGVLFKICVEHPRSPPPPTPPLDWSLECQHQSEQGDQTLNRTLSAMPVTSAELKNLVLRAMQRKNQQRLMEVKMTRVLEKCLLCLMADISTMWISRFFVTTAYVYSMSSDRFFLPSLVSIYLVSISFFQGSGEQSQELYTFHEAVSQLQDAEDKLMDDDRNNIEVSLF